MCHFFVCRIAGLATTATASGIKSNCSVHPGMPGGKSPSHAEWALRRAYQCIGCCVASCRRSGRRIVRTAWSPCPAHEPSGCRVVRTEWSPRRADSVVAVLGVRTEWLPRHADSVVDVLGVRTEWLPCREYGPHGRRVGRKDRVVAVSCGQRGRRVERTDCVVDVLGIRTEWSPCRS